MYKLLRNANGNYIYDARLNQFKRISDELYSILQENPSGEERCKSTEFRELQKLGFFLKTDFEIIHPYVDHLKYILDRGLNKLILQVTQNCNLRCSYCPYTENEGSNRHHNSQMMTWETAKKALDFFASHSTDSQRVHIGFYGGEPLLNKDVIIKSMEYARSIFEGKYLTFGITTNATLLSDDIIAFFDENEIYVTLSLDGPQEIHDLHRKFAKENVSTFEFVKSALERINSSYPNLQRRTSINMVMNQEMRLRDYNRIFEDLPYIKDYPISATMIDDSYLTHKYKVSDEFWAEYQYYQFVNMLRETGDIAPDSHQNVLIKEGRFNDMQINDTMMQSPIVSYAYPAGPCIPGYTSLFVSLNENLLPCEKVSETQDCVRISTLDSGLDMQRCLQLLNIAKITEKECKSCWCIRFCSTCCYFCYNENGFSSSQRCAQCQSAKQYAEEAIQRYLAFNPQVG